jgi:hypothetical protein
MKYLRFWIWNRDVGSGENVEKEKKRRKPRPELLDMTVTDIIKRKDERALEEESFDVHDSEAKLSYLRLAIAQERYKVSEKHSHKEYVV